MTFAQHVISSCRWTLETMVTTDTDTTNGNLLTQIVNKTFQVNNTVMIRNEETMDCSHMFKISICWTIIGNTHQKYRSPIDRTDIVMVRTHIPLV